MQLWSEEKEMVYQRVLKRPLTNRNLIGNHFIYQEDEHTKADADDTFEFGIRQDTYIIVKILSKDCVKEVTVNIIEDNIDDPDADPSPIENICGVWEKKDDERIDNPFFFIIADHTTISYIDLTPHSNKFTRQQSFMVGRSNRSTTRSININRSEMHKTVMQEGWKIHQIQEIHPKGQCSIVCEDISKSELVFFHIQDLKDDEAIFRPLAPHVTDKNRSDLVEYDNIEDYQSLMCYQ